MRVVAATDLSDAGILAIEGLCACEASLFEHVLLLHVVDLDLYTAGGSVPGIVDWARERLAQEAARLGDAGFTVTTRVEQGPAAETIDAVAVETEADLVLVTNLGKGVAMGRLLGSTAERIATTGRRPVLIDRVALAGQEWCRAGRGSPFVRVLVGAKLDDSVQGLLATVKALPGVEAIRVVHVTANAADSPILAQRLDDGVGVMGPAGTLETDVLVGDPAERLLQDASPWGATTIALAPCRHGLAHRAVFGSVARAVALHADRPVLLVPTS